MKTAMSANRKSHRSPPPGNQHSRPATSLNSTVIFPLFTHPHHTRSRSSRAVSTVRRPTSASPSKYTALSRLRERNKPEKTANVSPELAAKVVKDYIIPMFEADARVTADKHRESLFGQDKDSVRYIRADSARSTESSPYSDTKGLDTVPGTLFAELKLSEQLQEQLNRVKLDLMTSEAKARTTEQAKESLQSEAGHLRLMATKNAADLKLLGSVHFQALRNDQLQDLEVKKLQSELEEMRRLYKSAERKAKEMSAQLNDLKAKNDIRFYKPQEIPLNSTKQTKK